MRKLVACLTVLLVSAAVPVNAAKEPQIFHTGIVTKNADQGFRVHAVNTRGDTDCMVEIEIRDSAGLRLRLTPITLPEFTGATVPAPPRVGVVQQLWARGENTTPRGACNVVFTAELFLMDAVGGGPTQNVIDFKPCFNPQPEPPGLGC